MKKRIVIIGGCAAGPKTAAKSRRMNPDSEITLFTKSPQVSYSACGLPYYVGNRIDDIKKLEIRTVDDFKKNNINIHLNSECTKILPHKKEIIVNNEYVPYDDLVIATGAIPNTPNIKNCKLKNVFHLRFLSDGVNVKNIAKMSKSVLIIGFGYIGLEMVEAFLNNGLKVHIVENHPHIMSFLDEEFSDLVEKYIKERDKDLVEIYKDDLVTEFIGEEQFEAAITESGKRIEADFCLIATGVEPNTSLAKDAGVMLGYANAIKVNHKMQTNIENIWACGDCCTKYCLITKLPTYFALGSIANKEGRVCAINLNGEEEHFPGVLGSSVTKYYDFSISVTGINHHWVMDRCREHNVEAISATVTKLDRPSYMPEARPITIKVMADKKTGKLIGAQGVGIGDVDKRINIMTSALLKGATVDDFMHLDLTYTPTISGTIDPLLTACYKLKEQM